MTEPPNHSPRARIWCSLFPIMALGFFAFGIATAQAELKVRMPTVEYRELELEHNGLVTFGRRASNFDRAQSYTNEIGFGVMPWWQIELEGALEKAPDQSLRMEAVAFENTFQLTEPGAYFFNLGFFVEYEHTFTRGAPNSVTFGPIIQKELPNLLGLDTVHTANLLFTRDIGANATRNTGFTLAWQSVAFVKSWASPGVEYYGKLENLSQPGRYNAQQHLIGPVVVGRRNFAPYGNLKYEVGYLVGLTSNSPSGAVRWRLEYEIAF